MLILRDFQNVKNGNNLNVQQWGKGRIIHKIGYFLVIKTIRIKELENAYNIVLRDKREIFYIVLVTSILWNLYRNTGMKWIEIA